MTVARAAGWRACWAVAVHEAGTMAGRRGTWILRLGIGILLLILVGLQLDISSDRDDSLGETLRRNALDCCYMIGMLGFLMSTGMSLSLPIRLKQRGFIDSILVSPMSSGELLASLLAGELLFHAHVLAVAIPPLSIILYFGGTEVLGTLALIVMAIAAWSILLSAFTSALVLRKREQMPANLAQALSCTIILVVGITRFEGLLVVSFLLSFAALLGTPFLLRAAVRAFPDWLERNEAVRPREELSYRSGLGSWRGILGDSKKREAVPGKALPASEDPLPLGASLTVLFMLYFFVAIFVDEETKALWPAWIRPDLPRGPPLGLGLLFGVYQAARIEGECLPGSSRACLKIALSTPLRARDLLFGGAPRLAIRVWPIVAAILFLAVIPVGGDFNPAAGLASVLYFAAMVFLALSVSVWTSLLGVNAGGRTTAGLFAFFAVVVALSWAWPSSASMPSPLIVWTDLSRAGPILVSAAVLGGAGLVIAGGFALAFRRLAGGD